MLKILADKVGDGLEALWELGRVRDLLARGGAVEAHPAVVAAHIRSKIDRTGGQAARGRGQ